MAGILSIQLASIGNDKKANLAKVSRFLEENNDKKLDLVLLPEFFLTGATQGYAQLSESSCGGEPLLFLAELARKYNTNIACGSIIAEEGEKKYNRLFVLNRQGKTVAKYDKIHLFNYFGGTEGQAIEPGDTPVVVDLDFAKVGLSVCFDIRYPYFQRKLVQMGAELVVNPTAWGCMISGGEQEAQNAARVFESMNISRAHENLVYFASSDQCGDVGNFVNFVGSSMIVSPMGEVLANAHKEECAIYADIDINVVRELRKTFPAANID